MKTCVLCGEEKRMLDFYRHPNTADKRLNKCKACCKQYAKKRYANNPVVRAEMVKRVAAWKRAHPEDARRSARRRARLKYKGWRPRPNEASILAANRAKHPGRNAARKRLQYAIDRGYMARGPCEVCGDVKSHGHHDDYSKPLDVRWLCHAHHAEHHRLEARKAS